MSSPACEGGSRSLVSTHTGSTGSPTLPFPAINQSHYTIYWGQWGQGIIPGTLREHAERYTALVPQNLLSYWEDDHEVTRIRCDNAGWTALE